MWSRRSCRRRCRAGLTTTSLGPGCAVFGGKIRSRRHAIAVQGQLTGAATTSSSLRSRGEFDQSSKPTRALRWEFVVARSVSKGRQGQSDQMRSRDHRHEVVTGQVRLAIGGGRKVAVQLRLLFSVASRYISHASPSLRSWCRCTARKVERAHVVDDAALPRVA